MFEQQAYCILFLGVLYETDDNDPVKITQRIKESKNLIMPGQPTPPPRNQGYKAKH